MKSKCFSKLKSTGTKKIIQPVLPSRKCKSIRVSPLESQINTGCANSPKNPSSPLRNGLNIPNIISHYVTKALAKPGIPHNKRSSKLSAAHRRTNSDGTSNNLNAKNKDSLNSKKHTKMLDFNEKTIKKDLNSQGEDIEKTARREDSMKKVFQNNDLDEVIREKLIEKISNSFKETGLAPKTTIDFYKLGRHIGNGAFGKVSIALNRLTGHKIAIKTIENVFIKDERTRRKIFQEVFIMKKLKHRNIIRLLEVFESNKNVMIVLEYAGGGDLLQIIKARGRLTEDEARGIFYQLIEAIKFCHDTGIIHRDIKLDNILLTSDYTDIKLCDFGVSRFAKTGEKVHEQCGTPAYLAPEIIINQGYEPFYVDIWSMGVLLYTMLSASVPFKAKNLSDLHKLILKGSYEVPEYFSLEAKDIISKMLNPIPNLRISLDDMKTHPWYDGFQAENSLDTSFNVTKQNEIINKINTFGFPQEYVIQSLNLKDDNHASATYNLLELESSYNYT
ncbi:hypothetical protein SteCoe_21505 [Stentor coeruleus]|uniref:Protein kinase domain-containing protein n=1 Tax=Stentor coeruleus TaxID=5963 RepID=A0A1R2BPC2_9CILI|nr:hypothetical protein SteCoe_21505 [Stentor coeruleus]